MISIIYRHPLLIFNNTATIRDWDPKKLNIPSFSYLFYKSRAWVKQSKVLRDLFQYPLLLRYYFNDQQECGNLLRTQVRQRVEDFF